MVDELVVGLHVLGYLQVGSRSCHMSPSEVAFWFEVLVSFKMSLLFLL